MAGKEGKLVKIIDTSRTKMYELVQKYCPYGMPAEKNTVFEKTHRDAAYWLSFSEENGKWVTCYLEVFRGEPCLRIYCRTDRYDVVIHPAEEDMEGMLEERKDLKTWIIRWMDGVPESKTGTEEEVERYAERKAREKKCGYIIA